MSKLSISPDVNGYGAEYPSYLLTHSLLGGYSRSRRDIDEHAITIKVKWSVNQSEFSTISAFFAANCHTTFLIDLILLQSEPTEETAILVPNSFNLVGQNGNIYICEAQLEVLPDLSTISCQMGFVPVQTELGFVGANNTITQLEYFIKNLPGHWG